MMIHKHEAFEKLRLQRRSPGGGSWGIQTADRAADFPMFRCYTAYQVYVWTWSICICKAGLGWAGLGINKAVVGEEAALSRRRVAKPPKPCKEFSSKTSRGGNET